MATLRARPAWGASFTSPLESRALAPDDWCMSLIQPRTLRGFRDLMPRQAMLRADLATTLATVFRQHGYAAIDTPALEYAEILKGKGGEDTDKELFEWTDKGGRQVALRFDLTVPLARYVAQHHGTLGLPFRRYHMGPVWRGERPQKGRYREFWQCDADLIGPVSDEADAEIILLMICAYEALDVGAVTIRVNDRRILNGVLEEHGAAELAVPVLRALDKREKQGDEVVARDMAAAGLNGRTITVLLETFVTRGDDEATLAALEEAVGSSETGRAGVAGLRRVRTLVAAAGKPLERMHVDPAIARGLDYYTGIVMEARYEALPGIGSVGSGGRYDDLAGLYSKQRLPGVGLSVGIDRLLAALEETERAGGASVPSRVLVAFTEPQRHAAAFALAQSLRDAGIATEVYPEARKHGAQMKYADRQGIQVVVTANAEGGFHAKRMSTGETTAVSEVASLIDWIGELA